MPTCEVFSLCNYVWQGIKNQNYLHRLEMVTEWGDIVAGPK